MKLIKIFCHLFLVIILFGGFTCRKEKTDSPVVARVGNAELTIAEVREHLGSELENELDSHWQGYVYRWIDNELIYQSAVSEKMDRLPAIKRELERLKRDLIIERYVEEKITSVPKITEEEIAEYYDIHKENFTRDQAEYRYYFIIAKDKATAQKIKNELRAGTSFSQIVQDGFPDYVVNQRWDSDYVRVDQVIQPLQKNISRQRQGNIYGPVTTSAGHVVYQLVEKHDANTVRLLPLVRNNILQRLRETKYRNAYQQLVTSLKNNSKVDLFLSEVN